MGNVDNRANIGNQTIINIQNTSNIVLPGESDNSAGKQKKTVYFDENLTVVSCARPRFTTKSQRNHEKGDKASETVVCRFVDNLNETVSQSKRLINSVGELKTFVEI